MTDTYITADMMAAVGSELARAESYPIAESDIRKWALAVYYPDDPPKLFWDTDHAATTRYGGIVAPEDFNPFAWMTPEGPSSAGAGGRGMQAYEKAAGIAPPATKNQLNGGTESDFGVRMRPGDVITSVTRLHSYREAEGRLGVMLFGITEATWTNQDDEVVKRTRQTSIRY